MYTNVQTSGHIPVQGYSHVTGHMQSSNASQYYSQNQTQRPNEIRVDWKIAFTSGGFDGEPPLLEELGINFNHIRMKTIAVLNPIKPINRHIMDDADLAGPLLFCFLFGLFLLMSGKAHFSYIYGVATLGCVSMYCVLNLMSENGINWATTSSVLGYCLLPIVLLSAIGTFYGLKGYIGFFLSGVSVFWCTFSASNMFVSVLGMKDQRILVAYPIALLYAIFALMSVF
ncbi:Protein yipf5 [Coelomomyces lativittatus]|nr:Protein yipf5 [Coelomomyces lativittatus]KAJ1507896.1 Protein yipf5 [Coelomomyces lativittatus]KAJ1518365.1 Protein yipf5 [Coelomomyces lativittatus]